MGRLVPHGEYLFEGAEKFYVRSVSYRAFVTNPRGERYAEPEMWIGSLIYNNTTVNMYFVSFLNQPITSSAPTTFGLNTPILWR